MKKTYLLLIAFFLTIVTCYSQGETEVIDKVVSEVCSHLDTVENLGELTGEEASQIVRNAIEKHRIEWENGLDAIPNSRGNGKDIFTYLLNHRLLLDCKKFRVIDHKIDRKLSYNEAYRKLYLETKEFLIAIETGTDLDVFKRYFSSSIDQDTLINDLKNLKDELEKYKRISGVLIMKPQGRLGFYINIFDLKTGDENVAITVQFDNVTDNLIDNWIFKTKEEIAIERAKQEQEMDFQDIPPLSLPPTKKSKGNN